MAQITIPNSLKKHTNSQEQLTIAADNLLQLLEMLVADYPTLQEYIFTDKKQLRPFMGIFINNKLIRDLSYELNSEDKIELIPAVAGG